MLHVGWDSLIKKIEQDGADRLQKVKAAILNDLQRFKHADGIHFTKVVIFCCGVK